MDISDVVYEGGEWESPLVWRDRDKERGETILVDSVNEKEMLMLPEGFGERFVLKTSIGWTARSLRRVDSTSNGFE